MRSNAQDTLTQHLDKAVPFLVGERSSPPRVFSKAFRSEAEGEEAIQNIKAWVHGKLAHCGECEVYVTGTKIVGTSSYFFIIVKNLLDKDTNRVMDIHLKDAGRSLHIVFKNISAEEWNDEYSTDAERVVTPKRQMLFCRLCGKMVL